jgi:hypothetical protein
MGLVQEKGGNINLDVLKQILTILMKAAFGLVSPLSLQLLLGDEGGAEVISLGTIVTRQCDHR